jgi:hypothetical protein
VSTRLTMIPWAAKKALARVQNPAAVSLRSIVEDLAVGQAGVVIEGVVQVAVSQSPPTVDTGPAVVAVANRAAELAVPAAIGDATELLDVDMHQIARLFVFVTARRLAAHWQAGGLVQVRQLRHSVTVEHRTDCGPRYTEVVADTVRPPPAGEPQGHDAPLQPRRCAVRAGLGPRRTIRHPSGTFTTVAVSPLLRSRRRTLIPLRGPSIAPPALDDQHSQGQSAARGQGGISVDHEDLSVRGVLW